MTEKSPELAPSRYKQVAAVIGLFAVAIYVGAAAFADGKATQDRTNSYIESVNKEQPTDD